MKPSNRPFETVGIPMAQPTGSMVDPFTTAKQITQRHGMARRLPQATQTGPRIETPELFHVPDIQEAPWWLRAGRGQPIHPFQSGVATGAYPGTGAALDSMRMAGAWISPLNCVACTFASWGASPFSPSTIWSALISTDRTRGDFGHRRGAVVETPGAGYDIRGFSATSCANPADASIDALFTYVEPAGRGRVQVFSFSGIDAHFEGTTVAAGTSEAAPLLLTNPIVCSGRVGAGPEEVLLAFVSTEVLPGGRLNAVVNTGLLRRHPGGFDFAHRSTLTAYEIAFSAAPKYGLAAAFDSINGAWLLGWVDIGGNGIRFARVEIDGTAELLPFTLSITGNNIDNNGLVLSYNRRTARFLVQLEHDLAFVTFQGIGPRVPASQGDTELNLGGVWASTVDYEGGYEFAIGARATQVACTSSRGLCEGVGSCRNAFCRRPNGLPQTPAVRKRLRTDLIGGDVDNWDVTPPLIASDDPSLTGIAVQNFVRVPSERLVVALFTSYIDRAAEARFSFLPDESGIDTYGVPI